MMEDDGANLDLACAIALFCVFASALLAFVVASVAWGRRGHERLAKEPGLPLLGKVPMEAVYAAILPVGRALARAGISANTVTITSLGLASGAGALFAMGHFGAGAAVAVIATLADVIDGFVARETNTQGPYGQVLDTTIDRYVDAVLFGGIAVHVRSSLWLLLLTLAALTGGFMVSYASSVVRELKAVGPPAPMRRPHRVAYLLSAAALVPFAALVSPVGVPALKLAPIVVALTAIAVVGNVSAVTRLLRAARAAELAQPRKVKESGHAGRRIETVVTREHHP